MIVKIIPCLVVAILVQQSHQLANNRPILGVLLQEQHDKVHQYVASSYVKYLEMAGARVVPIFVNKDHAYYEHLLNQINGVLMPGGGTPLVNTKYSDAADLILDVAIAKNSHGIHFPVWGTCLSFQKFATYFTGNQLVWATRCDVDNISLKLEIPKGVNENTTQIFRNGGKIIEILTNFNVTPNYHISCLGMEYFEKTKNLTDQFTVISTNTFNKVHFVSTMEHKRYPLFASQWHPEKNQFEWVVGEGVGNINHDFHAIQVGQYFGNFLVNEARKNGQHFANKTEEAETLIYNFNKFKVYTGRERGADFEEIYKFPLKFP